MSLAVNRSSEIQRFECRDDIEIRNRNINSFLHRTTNYIIPFSRGPSDGLDTLPSIIHM